MNNGIQKLISMVLALSLCISVTTETAAATASSSLHAAASDGPAEQVSCETVTDTTQITEVVQDYWDNAYFEEVVIDPEQETVTKDGTKTTLQKALDLSRSDAEAAMESTDAAEEYFSGSIYHSETTKGGEVIVTAPFQTKRIVLFADALSDSYGAVEALYYPEYHEYILQYDTQEATEAAYSQLTAAYGSDRCFVDELISSDALLMDTSTTGPASCYSWGATLMGLEQLKTQAKKAIGNSTVTAAVLDTGLDTTHAFFRQRTISPDSYNFMENSEDISDVTGHGTHVAGIIADCTPSNVSLLILRVFNVDGNGEEYSTHLVVNTALQYAVEKQADVINMSFGWSHLNANSCTFLDTALDAAYQANIPICCAAGNLSDDVKTSYPACSKQTIAVSSINSDGAFDTVYSNYGKQIDFAAPGTDIVSAEAGGRDCTKTGTSMAAPHLTAAIAYLKLRIPSASISDVYQMLQRYAIDAGDPGRDKLYGWGYVNLASFFRNNPGGTHDLSTMTVTLSQSNYICDGTAKKPTVTLIENGAAVSKYNYTVSYRNNKQVGTATVTVTGIGNYKGSISKTFSITLGAAAISGAANGTSGVTVTWKRVSGASGYSIYRQAGTSSTWKKVKTITGNGSVTWTDSKVSNGTSYHYLVRAYCGKTLGAYKGSKRVYRLTRPSITSLKNKSSRKLTLTWKKNSKATGYQIQYSTKSSFRSCKTITIKNRKTIRKTISKLRKKKKYYVRIRCYKTYGGHKYYSAWSSHKAIKIKR